MASKVFFSKCKKSKNIVQEETRELAVHVNLLQLPSVGPFHFLSYCSSFREGSHFCFLASDGCKASSTTE